MIVLRDGMMIIGCVTPFIHIIIIDSLISACLQGGPDFYINVQDNSKIHGPGGQSNYPDPSEADICFAKVVNGFNVVDRIHKERVKPGDDYMAIESNVAIVSMKIQNFHDKEKVMK